MDLYVLVGGVSIIFLVGASEVVVRKLERIAKYYDVSGVVIGLTVVSVGTSLPEITSHLVSSFQIVVGHGDPRILSATVLGGNIGSDVVQQTLVLGLIVFLMGGFQFSQTFLVRGYAPMIGTTLLTLLLSWDGMLTRVDGIVLLSFFVVYMSFLYTTRSEIIQEQSLSPSSDNPRRDGVIAVVALLIVVVSAHFLFQAIEFYVNRTGLEGSLIGVVVLGVGAASPEMSTAIMGFRKGAEGISLGTLIGSNITNPLLGIGLGALISTYYVPRPLIYWDLPVETITAAILLTYLLTKDDIGRHLGRVAAKIGRPKATAMLEGVEERHLGRVGATLLIAMYFIYLFIRVSRFPTDF